MFLIVIIISLLIQDWLRSSFGYQWAHLGKAEEAQQ